MTGFPTRRPAELEDRPPERQWLVDGLWGRQAVGIIGGEPKCGKSFLALDLAVAVAAGVPCLRRFPSVQPGPVLMFAAEDAGHIVRRRLQGIAAAAGADFGTLDIAVIDVPVLCVHEAERRGAAGHATISGRSVVSPPVSDGSSANSSTESSPGFSQNPSNCCRQGDAARADRRASVLFTDDITYVVKTRESDSDEWSVGFESPTHALHFHRLEARHEA